MIDRKFLHETLHDNIDKILGKRIAILGCGAIGANLAISLARRGFKSFYLADYDKIQEHNISTQPWENQELGRLKTAMLSKKLSLFSNAKGMTDSSKIESTGDIVRFGSFAPDIIIDCFDNSESRRIVQEIYIKDPDYPVL